jgi:signal transduction histidine kinase
MPVPLILTSVSAVAFAIQFLTFAYIYSAHRVRFFEYLLWAWGAYTLSKSLKLVDVLVPAIEPVTAFFLTAASASAVGFTVAAALAHRRDYRLRRGDLALGVLAAATLSVMSGTGEAGSHFVGFTLGAVQLAAGILFWPFRSGLARSRGERLLAAVLAVWGGYRIAMQFFTVEPGTPAYWTVNAVFLTVHFLATFAVIIMVLERARAESERLHVRLREAERLAATGELAAGMAHEIRNPLAAIVNATALLTDGATLTAEERAQTLGAIRAEARRLNRILSDFLRPAGAPEPRLAPDDICDVVNHVTALIRNNRPLGLRVDVSVAADPMVPCFPFDRDQVTQVLWNVALNGVEAMDGRGRLSLEVARRDGAVAVAVTDTGRGIPSESVRKVFEPFYSSKPNGNGLGLTIAQRIVRAHGGRIDLHSEPGQGTCVTLLFPLNGHR